MLCCAWPAVGAGIDKHAHVSRPRSNSTRCRSTRVTSTKERHALSEHVQLFVDLRHVDLAAGAAAAAAVSS